MFSQAPQATQTDLSTIEYRLDAILIPPIKIIIILRYLMLILLFLVVEHTVAKAFEIGVGDLIFEFLAHTLGIICFFSAARAVTACLFQSFFYGVDNFRIGI